MRIALLGAVLAALLPGPLARAQESAIPRRLIVRYRSDAAPERVNALAVRRGMRERKHLRNRRRSIVELPSSADPARALAALRADQDVELAVPDVRMQATVVPNDPSFSAQWWLSDAADTDIDAPQAWDVVHDASGVVVAV